MVLRLVLVLLLVVVCVYEHSVGRLASALLSTMGIAPGAVVLRLEA